MDVITLSFFSQTLQSISCGEIQKRRKMRSRGILRAIAEKERKLTLFFGLKY